MCKCISRRKFLLSSSKVTLGAAATVACMNSCNKIPANIITRSKTPLKSIDLTAPDYEELQKIKGAAYVYVDGMDKPLILYRDSETKIFAYSSECTHLGVEVRLPNQDGLLQCPGDGGTYDVYGRVAGDPAPQDLKGFTAVLNDNIIDIYDLSPDV